MKLRANRKGMTLPIVIIIMTIMIILGFSTLYLTSNQSKLNIVNDDVNKALEYAEAGYNNYLWHLNDNLNFYSTDTHDKMMNTPIEFEDGYFMLEVDKPSDVDRFITIKSTGWSKNDPDIKRTILTKIRKKQFVHHVYVSDNDGDTIWWASGDESHGPYHTNTTLNIQQRPTFYDTVSYVLRFNKGSSYNPDYKVEKPVQPQKSEELGFPENNKDLRSWAEKDSMLFEGRTCIFLDGDRVHIRNQNDDVTKTYRISKDIPNLVIYVDKVPDKDKTVKGNSDKFGIRSGNVFVSGKLEGRLTIGAEENIYITYDNPTNWYDYTEEDIYNKNKTPNQPPTTFAWGGKSNQTYPGSGGIEYSNTYFNGDKYGTGTELSTKDTEKGIWTRYSFDKNDKTKPGKDMLGLIANKDILILHYGWPKKALDLDRKEDRWNAKWIWKTYSSKNVKDRWELTDSKFYYKEQTYDVAPHNITIHAALFSVLKGFGFGFEDYDKGARRGDITLWGNITQRKRKAVGTVGSTGYSKKYAHDPRMFYDYPPRILEPTNVGWEIHEWKEVKDHIEEKP